MIRAISHMLKKARERGSDYSSFSEIFDHFRALLRDHQAAMEIIADLGEKSGGDYIFDRQYLLDAVETLQDQMLRMVKGLNLISANRYVSLYQSLDRLFLPLQAEIHGRLLLSSESPYVIPLSELPLDTPELTGEKANTLAEILQRLSIPVPSGFVITSRTYRRFLEHNRLEERIHALLETWISGAMNEGQVSRQIQYAILAGVIPQDVTRAISNQTEKKTRTWAVRSSACGENGEFSFAGLHQSFLHVAEDGILEAYKKVLASLYSPEALVYRKKMRLLGEEPVMAVLCQEMIQSRASGVIHSLELVDSGVQCLAIYGSLGLGRAVVEGRGPIDRFFVERTPPHALRSSEIAQKEIQLRVAEGGGEEEVSIPRDEQRSSSLEPEQVRRLAKWVMEIERYFKTPQEVEWAIDEQGRCWILQSRRLAVPLKTRPAKKICETCALYPALIQDRGEVAQAGVGSGPVYIVRSDEDMDRFPEGGVLVSKYTSPSLARIVPKASAIIAERGSVAGHLATIAREFRVPALVDVPDACEILRDGSEVTLDTHQRTVYEGRVLELLQYELLQPTSFEESPEFRLLRRILRRVAPLTLMDPHASDFTPQGCKTPHDVIRFVHEKAIEELMNLPRLLKRFKGVRIWTLSSQIPLGLKILDIGGGIDPSAEGKSLGIDEIACKPFRALWEGISSPGAWSTEPVRVDFRGMMSSLTRTASESPGSANRSGFNLAVIGDTYMNLHLGLGYHFNLIDTRMETDARNNHVYFRFIGGVTDITRRSRRAQLLSQILTRHHFKVDTKGDLVVARITHLPEEDLRIVLRMLGRLIGFTRQLDIQLRNDLDVQQFAEAFLERAANAEKE